MKDAPHILLVNPYVWDFSAFDLWSKPLGMLYLAAVLRDNGYRVHWLDCLDVYFPGVRSFFPSPDVGASASEIIIGNVCPSPRS